MRKDRDDRSGAFGWGLVVGLALGVVAGAFLARGSGSEQMAELRARTIELTDSARRAAADPQSPVRRAIHEGVSAAKRRRAELDQSTSGTVSRVTELETDV
jgi:hypothetical protein